jgi:hypothetical protein
LVAFSLSFLPLPVNNDPDQLFSSSSFATYARLGFHPFVALKLIFATFAYFLVSLGMGHPDYLRTPFLALQAVLESWVVLSLERLGLNAT